MHRFYIVHLYLQFAIWVAVIQINHNIAVLRNTSRLNTNYFFVYTPCQHIHITHIIVRANTLVGSSKVNRIQFI